MQAFSDGIHIGACRNGADGISTRKIRPEPSFPGLALVGLLESIEASETSREHREDALDHGLGWNPRLESQVSDSLDMGKNPEGLACVSENPAENDYKSLFLILSHCNVESSSSSLRISRYVSAQSSTFLLMPFGIESCLSLPFWLATR